MRWQQQWAVLWLAVQAMERHDMRASTVRSVVSLPRAATQVRIDRAVAGGLFVLTLGLYLRTLAPDVADADGGEFQFVPYVLGIAHPPGYPLYTLLGRLFLLLPLGTVAFRMNAMTAVFGAAGVALVYLAAIEALVWSQRRWRPWQSPDLNCRLAALGGAMLLAVSATWWSHANTATVRTLNGLFVALCILLALRWATSGEWRWLGWTAFAAGLSLTHHISMWSLGPAFLIFVLVVDWRAVANLRSLIGLAWRLALPLLVYLYLPIRSAMGTAFDPARPTTVSAFLDLVSARGFSDAMFYYGWQEASQRLELLFELLLAQFGWAGIAFAGLGIGGGTLLGAKRSVLLSGSVVVGNAIVALGYRNAQTAGYLVPSFVAVALCISIGASAFGAMMARLLRLLQFPSWGTQVVLGALVLLIPSQILLAKFGSMDRSGDLSIRNLSLARLNEAAPGSTIFADWQDAMPLWYLQLVEGKRPDVDVVLMQPQRDRFPHELAAERLEQGEVYLTDYHRDLVGAYRTRPRGPLVQLLSGPDLGAPAVGGNYIPSGANFDRVVSLIGYRTEPAQVLPGEKIHFTLYWKALAKIDRPYTVFVQLLGPSWTVWGQHDRYPVRGQRPTTTWEVGEVVADEIELTVAADTPPGEYEVIAGMYETPAAGQWRRLQVEGGNNAGQDTVGLRRITVIGRQEPWPAPQFATNIVFGDLAKLIGYDINHWSATSLGVTLYWSVLRTPGEDMSVGLNLRDEQRRDVGQHSSWPMGGVYPTTRWLPGQLVSDRHEVALSKQPQGSLDMQVKLLSAAGQEVAVAGGRSSLLKVPEWLNNEGKVRINFDNKALLTQWAVEPKTIGPEGELSVLLQWEPLRPLSDDISVLVHLLGKDGRLWGWSDGIPVFGGYPSLSWVKGRPVRDRHILAVQPGIPPGEYDVEVAVELIRTGDRWPVLDRALAGSGQSDRVLLGPVYVRN